MHTDIINEVFNTNKKGHRTIKDGYARYTYRLHCVFDMKLYATNDVFEIDLCGGDLNNAGICDSTGFRNAVYIDKNKTRLWKAKDWNKYKAKTIQYLNKLIEYANLLSFSFEGYENLCISFDDIIKKYCENSRSEFTNDAYLSCLCDYALGDYFLNLFVSLPVSWTELAEYVDVEEHTAFIECLIKLLSKNYKVMHCDKFNKQYEKWLENADNIDIDAIAGKMLIASLTDKEKNMFAPYIYVG